MAFRDDLEAAHARIAALEEDNQRLREAKPVVAPPALRGPTVLEIAAATSLSAALIGLTATVGGLAMWVALALAGALLGFIATLTSLVVRPGPGEVAVLVGSRRRAPGGRELGYRIVAAGAAVRIPLIERATMLNVRPMALELLVTGVYARGGQPMTIACAALVRIDPSEPAVHDAIERFLGAPPEQVATVARQTLEGHVRAVASQLTADELRAECHRYSEMVLQEAEHDLARMGLRLDTVTITPPA